MKDLDIQLDDKWLLNCYVYGSQVYETTTPNSDHDYIYIVKDGSPYEDIQNVFTVQDFEDMLYAEHITALECFYLPKKYILKEEHKFTHEIDRYKLRTFMSGVTNNSYAKCKKKLREGERYIAIKSLWHSLRIALFVKDLLTTGSIDYTKYHSLFNEIVVEDYNKSWEELHKKYKQRLNDIASTVRAIVPKEDRDLSPRYKVVKDDVCVHSSVLLKGAKAYIKSKNDDTLIIIDSHIENSMFNAMKECGLVEIFNEAFLYKVGDYIYNEIGLEEGVSLGKAEYISYCLEFLG